MSKLSLGDIKHVQIPDNLKTKSLQEATVRISISVTIPKEYEAKSSKWMYDIVDDVQSSFKKFIKKQNEKQEEA